MTLKRVIVYPKKTLNVFAEDDSHSQMVTSKLYATVDSAVPRYAVTDELYFIYVMRKIKDDEH